MKAFLARRWVISLVVLIGITLLGSVLAWQFNPFGADNYVRRFLEREQGETDDEGTRREDWLFRQRAYPADSIPADAGARMLDQLTRQEAQYEQLRLSAALEPEQQQVWAALGPQPILSARTLGTPRNNVSGRVSAIAVDPRYNGSSNQTVYIGGAQGGIWKSTDAGANWTPLTDNQPSLASGAIAIDPNNANIVYAGTGEGSRCALCYYGAGLLKSNDGGATWSVITGPTSTRAPQIPVFLNATFTRLAIDSSNTSTIYACTTFGSTAAPTSEPLQISVGQVGVWKSTDGGASWRNLDPGGTDATYTAHDFIIDPQNPQRVYAGMRTIGLYRSEQGGEPGTWQRLTGGLPDVGANPTGSPSTSPFRRLAMASGPPIAPSTNTTLYVAFAKTDDSLLGIWRSTDNGASWSQVTLPQSTGQANYSIDIAVDPTNGSRVYYGTSTNANNNGGTVWRSDNAGGSWTDISRGDGITGGLHVDTHQIVLSPDGATLFTGNDGGVWRTNNPTAATVPWTQLNNTLNLSQFMAIALHPTDPNIIIGGTQDNGTNRFRGSLAWDHVADGDGGFVVIDQSNPQVMYHTFYNVSSDDQDGALIGPEISTNGGSSWTFRGCDDCTARQGGFNPKDRVAFYAPMAGNSGFTSASGNVIYFGTYRLYRTADRGVTWTGLGASSDNFGADLTKGAPGVISTVVAYPAVSGNSETVWVGTSDGNIQVSVNAGALASATFTNVTKAPLPNRYVSDIALDAGNAQRAVAVYSGFNSNTPSTPGHIFLTGNRGGSWQDISGNLPDVPVTSVALNPNNTSTIYLGTDLGVFQTTNGGATWERLGNGMPRVATFMVRYHAASNSLVAATHGRGIFRLTTARAVTTVSAASFAPVVASEAIVAAFGPTLATQTAAAVSLPLPVALGGSRVLVKDAAGVERLAPLFFVSPGQINYQIPAGTTPGTATITITASDGTVSTGTVEVGTVAPSLFAQNSNGQGVPAGFALRVRGDGSQQNEAISTRNAQNQFVPTPIDLGPASDQVFLVLFGTGLRFRSALSNVTATIGGEPAEVVYAGAQGTLVGLDQVNLRLPRSFIGRGEVEVVLSVDGRQANVLRVSIK